MSSPGTAAAALTLSLALVGLVAGCGDDEAEPATDTSREAARVDPHRIERTGEALYRRYCALCHGRDGEGYAADDAPSLRSEEWLRTASDDFITAAIADGRPGTPMSAWSRRAGGPLNDGQIQAILVFLRSEQRSPRVVVDEVEVTGDATAGAPLFAQHCARCHGARGEGVDAIALANPALLGSASDGFLQYAIAHGRTGTRMPAFREQLEPGQIDDLVTFVRSLAGPRAAREHAQQQEQAIPTLDDMQLVINESGEAPDFELRDGRFVPAADVAAALDQNRRMVILDARATSDWLTGRIPGAIPVPFYELGDIIEGLPRDGTPMIAYCACPHAASGRVVDALRAAGFTNTSVLDEGILHWQEHDYPMASGPDQP